MDKKEMDVSRRMTYVDEVARSKRMLTRMLRHAGDREEPEVERQIMVNIDELDLLTNDIEHKAVGRKYSMFDPKQSANRGVRKKMAKLDERLEQRLAVVTDATSKINQSYMEGELDEPVDELAALHHYILEARNVYEDRDTLLKGVD